MITPQSVTISVPEAARLLGISARSAYRAANSGVLPSIRIRGRIVVPTHRLVAMLEGQPVAPEGRVVVAGASTAESAAMELADHDCLAGDERGRV
jgi:excisionase family DNA binding protein